MARPGDNLPAFQAGQRFDDLSAGELRAMVEAVRRADNIVGGPGIDIRDHQGGKVVSLAGAGFDGSPDVRTCVVAKYPDGGCSRMLVREVKHYDAPPQEDRYTWAGPPFWAYPDFGRVCEDYRAVSYAEEGDDVDLMFPPGLDAPFLRVRPAGDTWIVEYPSAGPAGGRFVILRGYHPASGEDGLFVLAETAVHSDTDPWDGQWTIQGSQAADYEPEPYVVATYPHVPARYYEPWFWRVADGPTTFFTDVLPVTKIAGVWTLERPIPPIETARLQGNPVFAPRCDGTG